MFKLLVTANISAAIPYRSVVGDTKIILVIDIEVAQQDNLR